MDSVSACMFSVSGLRKVSALLFKSRKRLRIYDMEGEEDDEDETTLGTSNVSSDPNTSGNME